MEARGLREHVAWRTKLSQNMKKAFLEKNGLIYDPRSLWPEEIKTVNININMYVCIDRHICAYTYIYRYTYIYTILMCVLTHLVLTITP